jgi:pimeloyl-ACP methyl ester carboxylesterase
VEWEKPFSRGFLERLAQGCTLVRYDMRGSGLSDPDVSDLNMEAFVRDLEAVVDHLALERFALLAFGGLAGPIAMTYAAARRSGSATWSSTARTFVQRCHNFREGARAVGIRGGVRVTHGRPD